MRWHPVVELGVLLRPHDGEGLYMTSRRDLATLGCLTVGSAVMLLLALWGLLALVVVIVL